MADPIKDKILQRLEEGQTIEEIQKRVKDAGGWNAAVEQAFIEAQKEYEKKNSTSTSESTSETESMEPTSTIDGAQPQEEDSLGSDSRVAQANRARDLAATIFEMSSAAEQDANAYDNSAFDLWAEQPSGFRQAGGAESITQEEYDTEANIRNLQAQAFKEAKPLQEIQDIRVKNSGVVQKVEEQYSAAFPDSEINFFQEDETGITIVNPIAAANLSVKLEELQEEDERRLQAELEKVEDLNEVQEFMYDMNTGLRGIGYGLQGLWDPEQSQYNLYNDQFRGKASLLADGVSLEQQQLGITKNAANGDWDAATAIFMTQLANTVPQLAIQAAITYTTGGIASSIGLSAGAATNASLWTSSLFMGATTFGTTSAQYYGLVDDSKRRTMAFGDALIETLSERAFPDDMMALTKKQYKNASLSTIRNAFFKKGFMTKEFKELAIKSGKRGAIEFVESGLEEGAEEIIATIGSQWVHASINDEEFNLIEAVDAFIVGFGAGAGSRFSRGIGQTIQATASSLGYGGFRTDFIKIKGAKQKLAAELSKTSDQTRIAQIQSKINELTKIELASRAEQRAIYDKYSDEDAEATISNNQKFHNAIATIKKNESEEAVARAKEDAAAALESLKSIEAKYETEIQEFRNERKAISSIKYGRNKRIDLNKTENMQGSKILQSLKNVAKALGSPVYAYGSYSDMAEALGLDVAQVSDSRGIFEAGDGTIHIMTPAALDNTAFHEGIHKIARGIDPEYIERFVEGALDGMPEELARKYTDFAKQYKYDKERRYEEMFAEMNADIATGVISIEGFGASLASLALRPVIKTLQKAGFLANKNTATFNDFVEYVQSVNNSFKEGKKIEAASPVKRMHDKLTGFVNQLAGPRTQRQSPQEIYGDFDPSKSSTFANMTVDENGNFVFLHVSPNKFENLDPTRVGSNLATGRDETMQINAARTGGVSMFYTASEDVDVIGENRYHYIVDPKKVYNGVEDPQGLYEQAKSQIQAMGVGATPNTVYAKMTQIANQMGFDVVVMPWKDGSLKAQTTKKLPVQEAEVAYKSNKSNWESVAPVEFNERLAVNRNAEALYNSIEKNPNIPDAIKEDIRGFSYKPLDGRFGALNSAQEYIDRLNSFAETTGDATFTQAANSVSQEMTAPKQSGYSTRKQTPEARAKLKENIRKEFSGGTFGFTFDPITGEAVPTGTAVADGVNENIIGDMATINEETIDKVIDESLKNPMGNVGGWIQNEEFYLDVSEVYASEETAYRLGDERGEIGIYNIGEQKYIEIKRDKPTLFKQIGDIPTQASDLFKVNQVLTESEMKAFQDGEWLSDKTLDEAQLRSETERFEYEAKVDIRTERLIVEEYVRRSGVSLKRYAQNLYNTLDGYSKSWKEKPVELEILGEMLSLGLMDNTVLIIDDDGRYHEDLDVADAGGVFNTNRDDVIAINGKYETTLEYMAHIIVHEQMHRLTALANKPRTNFGTAMDLLYNEIKSQVDKGVVSAEIADTMYGMSNTDELIAEAFTSKSFQYQLQYIDVSEELEQQLKELGFDIRTRNMFQTFMDLVMSALGKFKKIFKKPSMLEAVISVADQEISRREDAFITPPKYKQKAKEVATEPTKDVDAPVNSTIMKQAMDIMDQLEQMGLDPVEIMVEQMNRIANEAPLDYGYNVETEPESDKINLADLKRRTGKTYKGLEYKDFEGIPMIFSISDQLTTGDVVNPYTGNIITRLMGGLGFHGASKKHSKLAWANIEDQKALDQINAAKEVYEKNKEIYDKAWADGRVPTGHVLMGIVRMGNSSMKSNEAVLRVLADNLKSFPKENKEKALKVFVQEAKRKIKENEQAISTGIGTSGKKLSNSTIKQKVTENQQLQDILNKAEEQGVTDISTMLTTEFLKSLKTIAAVAQITDLITYGDSLEYPNTQSASSPSKAVATTLLEGLPKTEREKIHLGFVMDVITEPNLKGVPQRSLMMMTAVDITEKGGLGESDHPNYPAAAKGKVLGVFKNPESVVNLFPEVQTQLALFAALEGVTSREAISAAKRFTERVPVQTGLANIQYRGIAINLNPSNADRLLSILHRAFPNSKLSTNEDVFSQLMEEVKSNNTFKNASGKVWGFRRGKRIFINENVHNSESELFNTKIGEMGQVWINYLSVKTDPKSKELLAKGFELTRGTAEYQRQLKKHNGNEELAQVDALANLIATKGQSIVDAVKRSNFKDWVLGLFSYIKSTLFPSSQVKREQIQDMTLNEVLNVAVADVLGGDTFKITDRQLAKAEEKAAEPETIMRQAGVYQYVKDILAQGASKSMVMKELTDLGYTKADAELLYQKALGYNQGSKAGYRAGVKERNQRFAEERKERLKNEREEAKLFRKRAKEIYKREKRVTDAMVDEIIRYLTGLKGVVIKPAQVKAILRMMKSANNKIHGNGTKQARNYGIFISFVDAVARIIDKQVEAKQLEDHAKLIRKVTAQQKKLMARVKKLTATSRSPIASYINQIKDLASVDAGLLSFETLQTLSSALDDLQNTAKAVGVKTTPDGKMLNKPYVYIESIDDYVDTRKAKIFFDEIFAEVNNEAEQRLEAMLIEQAMNIAFEEGGDWFSAYQELLRQRDMTPIQKKLDAIAQEMGLDLEDVDGLLAALELMDEQKKEEKQETRDTIIDDAIMNTFEKWRTLLMSNDDFADIFRFDEDADYDSAMRKVRDRMTKLTLSELKRLEFFMFDFIANGKTYGLQSLSAIAVAKNEGNEALRNLKMKASETKGAGSAVREGYFSLLENTPTFFRRIFKRYSQAQVAKFINAIGFGSLRNNVAQAEAKAATFAKMVQNMLSNKNLDNQEAQTRMLIYSVLTQKPEGVTDAAWVIQLKDSMELALANDKRLTDDDIKAVRKAMEIFGTGVKSNNRQEIIAQLEGDKDLIDAVNMIRDMFKSQEPRVRQYAESFLGMQFKEEENYLPMGFRRVLASAQDVDELIQRVDDVSRAFRQHAKTKAQAVAGAVYERNQDALKSAKMYIDLNMYSMMEKVYTENEIKARTAKDVSTIGAMTSEQNKDFVESVPSPEQRAQIRKKVYNFLVNASQYQPADEVLGKRGRKFANYMSSLTVVAYFGASIEQIVKQSSALMNALIETRSMAARLEYFIAIADAITPAFARGEKSWAIHNDKRRLMEKFGISRRDVVSETLSVSDGKRIGTKSRFERGVELSTTALRETDRVAATATWLAYYVDYLISEEGMDPDSIDFAKEADSPNMNAGQFADQMTIKDQNINSRRDKSRINEMTGGSALNLVRMIAMPFANFLLNKKMNMAIDFQKLTMGDAKNRKEGLLSLAGTLAEVAAFQSATWMMLAPLYQAVANALFGDDEEESWWDKQFGIQMVKRGIIMDLIPTPPMAAVENYILKGLNMATYALTEDSEDFAFADEEWDKGFERWERLNGLPIFQGQGRGDMNIGGMMAMLGVTGNVAHEMYLSAKNIKTLGEDQPYYTSKSGQKRYVSREEAVKMQFIEILRTSVNATMAVTGLHSKEMSKILKEGKRPIEKRSTADKEQFIAKEIMNDAGIGVDDLVGYLSKEIEGDPKNAMGKVDQVIKKAKGSMVDDLVSPANINTMRVIDKAESSNRGRAIYIHQIAQSLPEEERAQFYIDSYIYFGVKYGIETVKSQILSEILKY